MATKLEIFKQVQALCEEQGASEQLVKGLTELLEPKKGGMTVDIESIVKRDNEGNITEIKCRYSDVWLPANLLNFPKDSASKAINADGEALYTVSKQALSIKKAAAKTLAASRAAITNDVLDEVISPAEAKEMIANLSAEPDYSGIEAIVAE